LVDEVLSLGGCRGRATGVCNYCDSALGEVNTVTCSSRLVCGVDGEKYGSKLVCGVDGEKGRSKFVCGVNGEKHGAARLVDSEHD